MKLRISLLPAVFACLLAVTPAFAQTTPTTKSRGVVSREAGRYINARMEDNGGRLTLYPGDTLDVQLRLRFPSKNLWYHLNSGDSFLTRTEGLMYMKDPGGGYTNGIPRRQIPHYDEAVFTFRVNSDARPGSRELLRFVYLPPSSAGTNPERTWRLHVTISPRPVKRLP